VWEKSLDFVTNLQELVPQGFNVSSKGTLCSYCNGTLCLFLCFSGSN